MRSTYFAKQVVLLKIEYCTGKAETVRWSKIHSVKFCLQGFFFYHDQTVLSNLFCSTLNLLSWFDCALIGFALGNWLINYDQSIT